MECGGNFEYPSWLDHELIVRFVGDSKLAADELAAVLMLFSRGRRILREGVACVEGDCSGADADDGVESEFVNVGLDGVLASFLGSLSDFSLSSAFPLLFAGS
jgi:hypothetical protein